MNNIIKFQKSNSQIQMESIIESVRFEKRLPITIELKTFWLKHFGPCQHFVTYEKEVGYRKTLQNNLFYSQQEIDENITIYQFGQMDLEEMLIKNIQSYKKNH